MSDARSTTDPKPDVSHLTGPAIVRDVAAFWYTLGVRGVDGATGWVQRARSGRPPAARGADAPLAVRLRYEGLVQWAELRWLMAVVRDPDVWRSGWDRVVERGDAAREVLRLKLLSVLSHLPIAPRADPSVFEGATAPNLPVMPLQWSMVVPQRSALATRRHQHLTADQGRHGAPPPSRVHSVLSLVLAVAVAVVALVGLVVIGTAEPTAPAPATAAPAPAEPPAAAPAPAPAAVLRATAPGDAAHVEFRPDAARFDLSDDRRDGRTAVLQYKVDGAARPPLVSTGLTDGTHPPDQTTVSGLTPQAKVEFRVCLATNPPTVRDQNCGAWTTRPAA